MAHVEVPVPSMSGMATQWMRCSTSMRATSRSGVSDGAGHDAGVHGVGDADVLQAWGVPAVGRGIDGRHGGLLLVGMGATSKLWAVAVARHPCGRRAPDRSPPGSATAGSTDGTAKTARHDAIRHRSPIGSSPWQEGARPCSTRSSWASTAVRVGATRSRSQRAWRRCSTASWSPYTPIRTTSSRAGARPPISRPSCTATPRDLLAGELERTHVVAHAAAMPDGSPGRALHLAAKRHHASLIVVGSAHRGIIGRVLAGDVTMGTLHGAECPVIVAPQGSPRAARAADHRRRLRRLAGVARRRRAGARARDRYRRAAEGHPRPRRPRPSAGPRWATTPTGRSAPRSAAKRSRPSSTRWSPSWGTSPPARSSSAIPRPSWPTPATSSTSW